MLNDTLSSRYIFKIYGAQSTPVEAGEQLVMLCEDRQVVLFVDKASHAVHAHSHEKRAEVEIGSNSVQLMHTPLCHALLNSV